MSHELEEGLELSLDFNKLLTISQSGLAVIPVAVQDIKSRELLIVAFVNREALEYTLEHKVAAFWSTSRNELWIKGKTSGQTLNVCEIRVNCEQNSLLYLVEIKNEGACHTKEADGRYRKSCFYRAIHNKDNLRFTYNIKDK